MSRRVALTATALLAAGCTGTAAQSALDPAGVQAGHIHGLFDLYLGVAVVVYALVIGTVVVAVVRRNRAGSDAPIAAPPLADELRKGVVVAGAVGLTVVTLFALLIGDFVTGRRIESLTKTDALTIRVTGHQWWWQVQYHATPPSDIVTTANEIHIPAGKPVQFELMAADVIHSFWVPNLHGKTDLIPGHSTKTYLQADEPGKTYWGQCAEFCGLQHANMRFLVVTETEDDFQKWLAAQRQPAPEPTTESQLRGRQVFLTKTCVMCHAIAGTPAQSRVGPDLTHVAGRQRIAAGTLATNRGNLAGWVADPHGVKPGVRMPPNPLQPDELQHLLDYLETLK